MVLALPAPEAVEAVEKFRARLLNLDRGAASRLIRLYEPIWTRLLGDFEALSAQVASEGLTLAQAQRLARYQTLLGQVLVEFDAYAPAAAEMVTASQRASIELARQASRTIVDAALPRGLNLGTLAQAGIGWNTLPTDAFINLAGLAGNGAPLGNLLAELGPQVRAGITQALGEGIALGTGPRQTASLIRNRFGMGLTRSLRISRTETLRSYRESTRMHYASNKRIVKGYVRRTRQSPDTCFACIALDGKRYALSEPLNEHVSGRCVLVPVTLGYKDLGLNVQEAPAPVGNSRDWFRAQNPAVQRGMMGPRKFKAWKDGKFELEDMAEIHHSDEWGDQAVEAPLKSLVG